MEKPAVISYQLLRKLMGLLGVAFPVVLVVGAALLSKCAGFVIQSSISGYYYTVMRDVFVGTLCVIAFFLFSYKGYDRGDAVAAKAACVFALGVAFFPAGLELPYPACIMVPGAVAQHWVSVVHHVSAGLLFAVLTIFSWALFTKTSGRITPEKRQRNVIYRTCGVVMLSCIVLLGAYFALHEPAPLRIYKPVFWLETTALWAFGISWLTKGGFIFQDRSPIPEIRS